ncbi:hypothetical protein [Actinoplanes sp. N902-109]|uniref:hypothetical protein n=1 Tax=Actinoplanes sp. (strain N902-109) TaxID=649831 RepID=UPI0003A80046|nr:hypothetical protein [Actinoplanes sp. N902-109]
MRRRTVLLLGAGAGAATVLPLSVPASAAPQLREYPIQGSDATVRLLPGPAATLLLYAARRFHYEVDTLHPGEVVASADGTTLDLRPHWYAVGVSGGLLPYQVAVVRDILAGSGGMLAWGGDDAGQPREGRFRLTVAPANARLRTHARRLDGFERKRSQRIGAHRTAG